MVLTVTINPLLEKRFVVDQLKTGQINKSSKEYYYAGGKGINVSRQLNNLGIKNQALLFAGGSNGKILRRLLSEENIDFSIVNTKEDTRTASLVVETSGKKVTSFFGQNSLLQKNEVDELKDRLTKMIPNCSVVVFAGSSPCQIADEIFPFGIALANEMDKVVILDTYGNHLKQCLNNSPMVLHNNINELEDSLNIDLSGMDSKINFIDSLYKKGIKLSFITNGKEKSLASKFNFIYEIENPIIDTFDSTGSGDAFVSGIAFGLEKSLVFDEFVKIAAALGAVNSSRVDACNVSFEEMEKLVGQVKLNSIGKKMKLIDDTPTID